MEPERFLEALGAQTCRDFRLIVVDQNTDDRLSPILARFDSTFPILHLHGRPELSKARNLGLEYVTADLVAFPDDDCWYRPDLLVRVGEFLAAHTSWGGLAGRAVDQTGRPSAGRSDARAGAMTVFNLWKRVTTYTIFVRRTLVESVGGFDEKLGPGSGTPWLAGEDLDYVARAVRAGHSIYYDPTVGIYHPGRREHSPLPDPRQGFEYGSGVGRALRKNELPAWFATYYLGRSFGAACLSALAGNRHDARFYWAVGRGRMRGWRSTSIPDQPSVSNHGC